MNPSPSRLVSCTALAALLACAATAFAQTSLTWDITPGTAGAGDSAITGGTGIWNTTNGNWTSDAGANNVAWTNVGGTPKNDAIFGGTAGNLTLGEAVSLRNLTINAAYTITGNITGNTLNFTGGKITSSVGGTTIASAITGSPTVQANQAANLKLTFAPTVGSVTLGAITAPNGPEIVLAGTTTGNSLTSVSEGKLRMSSGTWTLTGSASAYEHWIDGGNLIISTGTLRNNSRAVYFSGGTIHYNNPAAVYDARSNVGIGQDFAFKGGSLDNTRGTPITTSTYNPNMTWEANWTFIGSNGANSNLFIGTGGVRLTKTIQVTVQNAAATFSVGGAVMNDLTATAPGLTKVGPGTLELRGNNTYTGATQVNEGTLAIPSGTSASNITIGASGTLQLTPGSTPSTTGSIDFASGSKVRLTVAPTLSQYILFTSTGPMTGTPVIETPVPGYALFIDGRSLKFAKNADADSDGLPDWWELQYSSAEPPNNTSLVASDDLDADGFTNLQEYSAGTIPTNFDTDADGLRDGYESNTGVWVSATNTGTNPLDNDTDNDSLLDGVETNTGIWVSSTQTGSNPHVADTDGDSYPDNAENNTGTYVSASNTGTNPNKADTDGDGAGDWYEIAATFTNPSSASSNPGLPYPLPDPDASTGVTTKPVKVFIMSGQSNMVGFGTVNGTDSKALSYITRTLNRFPNLIDSSGNFIAREDVKYRGVISAIGNGSLKPGFGANASVFGPELGFGQIMGWYHDEPVLLIKSSIGNRALGWDILPRGTPSWTYEGTTFPGYGLPTPTTPGGWYAGYEFDRFFMADSEAAHSHGSAEFNVVDVLDNFATQYPLYAAQGFEIAGFAWWQGDRDRYTMGHATQYEANLLKLITELRSYYSNRYPGKVVPNAPFVLATLGQTAIGDTTPAGDVALLNGMLAVDGSTGKYPQFAGNVKTVYSHPLSEGSSSNAHYDGRAGTYMMVGDALGRAMYDLLEASAGPDVTPPGTTGFNPANGASDVSTGTNLVATFSESITIGTGNITIHPIDNSGDRVIAITDATQVTVSGTTLTINPAASLSPSKQYAVQIDATAIDDLAGNSYAGITNNTTWSFTTATPDTTDPTLSTTNPANGASGVLSTANLVATFNESIAIGTGVITLRNLTDGSGGDIVIPVTDTAQVSISGSVLTVNPAANLLLGKTYAVQIAATAIDDLVGNSYPGILNDSTWSFATAPPDLTAPSPDPMSFAVLPNALGETTITMTATTATDPSGVEYLFECTAGGGPDSGWQGATEFTPTGLTHSTTYSYTVMARDTAGNETAPSAPASATTAAPDTTPPSPDPMTFASPPSALGQTSISMTATTATDPSGVQYFFECTAGGGNNSAWQDSPTYTDTGLTGGVQYTYKVRARDKSAAQTATAWSTEASTTTPTAPKTLYSSSAKTWNTTTADWGTVAGGPYNTATWSSGDSAIFEGTAGTVTLGEAINIKTLSLTNLSTTNKYTIAGSTLNFATGGSITTASTNTSNFVDFAYITSAITGVPNVVHGFSGANNQLVFAPASGSVALGTISGSGITRLAGSTTGNSLVGVSSNNCKIKVSSGSWTLTGTARAYEHWIEGGNLIISTGSLQNSNRSTNLIGGTLHYNNPGAVRDDNAGAGGDNDFRLRGGSLDNTSGAAITTSTWNPGMTWEANWTFIGSNGADSNLYLGNGAIALLGGTRQVTVTNAATTLTVGGVLSNGGLTKAGDGTLELRNANNTYTGATTVNVGTLLINGSTNASSAVTVNGGNLGGTGTVGGNVTVAAAGNLAPGVTAGTLNITGNLDITAMASGAGTLKFGLDALADTNDRIVVGGTLTLGALALDDLAFTNLGGLQVGTYTLITSTGLTGTVDGSTALIATGFDGKLQTNGNNLELVVTAAGAGSPYDTWAGPGVAFDADANGDGVDNGMAWVLGAGDENANAIPLLPTMDNTTDPDFFIFIYRRDDDANTDPKTAIKVEYGSMLSGWTTAVAGPDIIIAPTNDFYAAGIDKVEVKIRRTLAVGGKLFARLSAVNTP